MSWVTIKQAPLDTLGHVWCPELGARTDTMGAVYAYDAHEDGGRGVASTAKGFPFTHWHPLPDPPQPDAGTPDWGYFVPWTENRSPLGPGLASQPRAPKDDGDRPQDEPPPSPIPSRGSEKSSSQSQPIVSEEDTRETLPSGGRET